jgi:hypothetical protein
MPRHLKEKSKQSQKESYLKDSIAGLREEISIPVKVCITASKRSFCDLSAAAASFKAAFSSSRAFIFSSKVEACCTALFFSSAAEGSEEPLLEHLDNNSADISKSYQDRPSFRCPPGRKIYSHPQAFEQTAAAK